MDLFQAAQRRRNFISQISLSISGIQECVPGSDDVAINIGFRRRVPITGPIATAFAQAKVPTLYLSDVVGGKPARLATWVIRCHTDGFMLFDSVVGVAALVNLLCSLVAQELVGNGEKHLQKAEIMHQLLQELE
jgi:DNA-binding MurR/RpiR family transcriptional regulator